jgi:DNA replicative helicase MCM subunit Mcm2 (Cdc46/Mcm family)
MHHVENDEAAYTCPSCGERIVVPVDLSAGARQDYVEDCPVCCCPNRLDVRLDEHGASISARPD